MKKKIKMYLKGQDLEGRIILGFGAISLLFLLFTSTFHLFRFRRVPSIAGKITHVKKPAFVRGIHLTCWVAGTPTLRKKIEQLLDETELNTVVIDVKEFQGEVYIPGVPLAEKYKLYVPAFNDLKEYLARLKKKGIYTVARVVVFKDNLLPRKRPDLAVKNPDGSVWQDHKRKTWLDPYNKEVWNYALSVATQAISLGFEEVQYDYIRYPSDGDIKQCRYSFANHTSSSASHNLALFLQESSRTVKALGANLSIDVFGLTPSVEGDMGIGQKIVPMTDTVDFVSPMVYPSHYARGEYGIPYPNMEPYRVVSHTISDAKRRLGPEFTRLRPYLQDFSLGVKYGPKEVRAQIQACEELGIKEWILWNADCNYTRAALKSKNGKLQEAALVPKWMMQPLARSTAAVVVSTPAGIAEPAAPETSSPTAKSNDK